MRATGTDSGTTKAIKWLVGILRSHCLGVAANEVAPVEIPPVVELVERNRLEALVWKALPDNDRVMAALKEHLDRWRQAYEQSWLRNLGQLRRGLQVCTQLENRGIPCIGLRGPFAGVELYRDIAVRHFSDIDLLVRRDDRDRAWEVTTAMGFELHHPLLDRAACTRHHLEWPMRNRQWGVTIDLHWAIDHPYKLMSVDYGRVFSHSTIKVYPEGEWREPSPIHGLLLSCLHMEKECRLHAQRVDDLDLEDMAAAGMLRHALDVMMSAVRLQAPGWTRFKTEARAWCVLPYVATALDAASRLLELPLSTSEFAGLPEETNRASHRYSKRRRRFAGRHVLPAPPALGFRTPCLRDIVRYLFPPARQLTSAPRHGLLVERVRHTSTAIRQVATGGFDLIRLLARRVFVNRQLRGNQRT